MIRDLVTLSVKRPVTVFMVALAIVAFGGVGFSRLPINLLPTLTYPSLTVQTELPDAAPAEVENLVTKPVEETVGVLKGLRTMHSVSRAGISEVTLEFGWEADMDELIIDVREKLDRVVLPDEAETPIVLRYDPALDPIMRVAMVGSDNLRLMRVIADKQLKDEMSKIDGVASAQVRGGEEEEIQVNVNQGEIAAMGITMDQIGTLIAGSNINRPGGSLEGRDNQFLVRTVNEYTQVSDIGELVITPANLPPVRLREVAQVTRGIKDREEISYVNGKECVMLDIYKEGDANTVQVAKEVRQKISELPAILGQGMRLELLYDQSRFIEQSIREVQQALMIGGLLAILVLAAFLRQFKPTLIIAISIPISVMATFMLMYRLDVSLNIMSLGGLTLGIGMLVDSAIVVLESIQRHKQRGFTWRVAAIEGTSEVGAAVIASVLTTVAVFLPIVYVEGVAGQLFKDQAITVTISLCASLVAAISLIPMLASLERRKNKGQGLDGYESMRNLANLEKVNLPKDPEPELLGWFSSLYNQIIASALRFRWAVILVFMALFFVSVQSVLDRGRELMPPLTQGEFFFEVSMPEGTALPTTAEMIRDMATQSAQADGVKTVYATAGSRTVAGGLSLKTKDENLGQVNVVLSDRGNDRGEAAIANGLRDTFSRWPNLSFSVGRPSFFNLKTPIEIRFFSEDLDLLKSYTDELKQRLEGLDGVADLRSSLESGNPELTIHFDRDLLAKLGLSVRSVSNTLNQRINGEVVSQFKEDDRQVDIRLRNREVDRATVSDIENLVVAMVDNRPVTLRAVAQVAPSRGPAEIHRIKQSRVALISAEVKNRSIGEVQSEIEAVLAQFPPPSGIEKEWGGQNEEMKTSYQSLLFAMGLAIFLVYLVMAATFENLIHPLIILFTIPFAGIGVALGLLIGDLNISVIVFIGAIFLAGVVVNNAIVLVDAINQNRKHGMDLDRAIILAGQVRLRPILMTTLTTVLGLLPMALALGKAQNCASRWRS